MALEKQEIITTEQEALEKNILQWMGYYPSFTNLLVDCRLLLSLANYPEGGDNRKLIHTLKQKIIAYFTQNFIPILWRNNEGTSQLHPSKAFVRAFLQSIEGTMEQRHFCFDFKAFITLIYEKSLSGTAKLTLPKRLEWLIADAIKNLSIDDTKLKASLLTKIDGLRNEVSILLRKKGLTVREKQVLKGSWLYKFIVIFIIGLWYQEHLSVKTGLLLAISLLILLSGADVSQKYFKGYYNFADEISIIGRIKDAQYLPEPPQKKPSPLSTPYPIPILSYSSLESITEPSAIASTRYTLFAEEESTQRRIKTKTRSAISAAETKLVAQPSRQIDFSETLGFPAIYDPEHLIHSQVGIIENSCVPNFFATIAPDVMEEIPLPTQRKFHGLIHKAKLIGEGGEQGIKRLCTRFIQIPNENSRPCYELKIVGREGDHRLIGYLDKKMVDGKIYNIIIFLEYAHTHSDVNNAFGRMQYKVMAPISETRPTPNLR